MQEPQKVNYLTDERRDDTPVQLNARIPKWLRDRFRETTTALHTDQNEIIHRMILAFTEHAGETSLRHLDGSLCPMTNLCIGLEEEIRKHFQLIARTK